MDETCVSMAVEEIRPKLKVIGRCIMAGKGKGAEVKPEVPKTNLPDAKTKGTEGGEKKAKNLIPDIIRGRMPILVVHMVRFGDQKNGETKDLAPMFGTTVGKIADIKKKSTFAYLPEKFKPTAEQKADAIAWLQKHVGYKEGKVDGLIEEAESYKVATAEETAEFEKIRVAAKGQKSTTKEGETADAGGGNRRTKPAKPAEAEPKGKATAGDLLK